MTGKIALITGAGSGIGRATAIALYNAGYAVTLTGRRADKLEETAAMAKADARRVLTVAADIGDPASVAKVFAGTREKFGRLDLLFNNAGAFNPPGLLEDIPYDEWKRVVDTNLNGAFLCTQEAFRIMKSQQPMGGRIINNGSISAHAPRPNSVAYTSTKHAMTGLTKSTSLDGRKYDIACGQIDIGNAASKTVGTRMNAGMLQPYGATVPEPTMPLDPVARAILYMDSLPLDSNVQFMTVMATKMPYIGRG